MERHLMVTVWRAVLVTEDGDSYTVRVAARDAEHAATVAEVVHGEEVVMVESLELARRAS